MSVENCAIECLDRCSITQIEDCFAVSILMHAQKSVEIRTFSSAKYACIVTSIEVTLQACYVY